MKIQLTAAQRDQIRVWLVENQQAGDEDVLAIAAYVANMQLEALAEHIQDQLRRNKQTATYSERESGARYYPLLLPPENGGKPIVVSEGKDERVLQYPSRKQVNVRMRDLDAFCKANGLDRQKVIDLGEGRIASYRGWERSSGMGPSMMAGQPYQGSQPKYDPGQPAGGRQQVRVIGTFAEHPAFFDPDAD